MIHRCEQCAVAARESLVPYLQRRRRAMRVSLSKTFLRTRTRADATRAVEAHMGDPHALRDGLVVRRADDVHVDVVHGGVVVEPSAIPVATRVSNAEVAEAVVDTAVEADVPSPIAGVPQVHRAAPAPVTRRPQRAEERREHPGSGHPVIAIGTVRPVARYPDVFGARTDGLRVHGKRRWCERDRYEHGSRRCERRAEQRDGE